MPDDDRLARLFRTFGPLIYARCRRMLDDAAAAEDATQETFLRVQRHLDRAPPEALAWIYRIATNYCLNELRDRSRRAEPREQLPENGSADLEGALADRDLAARLVARAAPKLRAVAWLHHVDGLEQAEVARVLGVSRRTVVGRLAAFRQNAQKFLRRSNL
jgi:RNA polymerase sigma-70 factor (ECF subfamily)